MLKETFIRLLENYTKNGDQINELWLEIEAAYSEKTRYYHTLDHLENLLVQLTEVKDQIQHWETVLFTLYYHDVVYDAQNPDNEEKSAELAEKRMKQIGVPDEMILECKQQILATKAHFPSISSDINYFIDADLAVLGQSWEMYAAYYQNIRKEYAVYPDLVYNPGRTKVLNHFLSMERIYKSDYFYEKLEIQAKENMKMELALL